MRNHSLVMLGCAAGLALWAAGADAQVNAIPTESKASTARTAEPVRSDAQVGLEVHSQLTQQMQITGLTAQTRGGVAHLQGTVRTPEEKERAEQIALSIPGVERVENGIIVDAQAVAAAETNRAETADSLEAEIHSNLLANPQLAGHNIAVQTRGNIVTLTGEVSTESDKELAGRIAADTREISEVRNRLVVRGQ
jgi:osmotically-inducible protein OsmY